MTTATWYHMELVMSMVMKFIPMSTPMTDTAMSIHTAMKMDMSMITITAMVTTITARKAIADIATAMIVLLQTNVRMKQ